VAGDQYVTITGRLDAMSVHSRRQEFTFERPARHAHPIVAEQLRDAIAYEAHKQPRVERVRRRGVEPEQRGHSVGRSGCRARGRVQDVDHQITVLDADHAGQLSL
jgi:hypothetical protein